MGVPTRSLWNTSLELPEIIRALGLELWERVQEAGGWDRRFAELDDVLCDLLRDDPLEPVFRVHAAQDANGPELLTTHVR